MVGKHEDQLFGLLVKTEGVAGGEAADIGDDMKIRVGTVI